VKRALTLGAIGLLVLVTALIVFWVSVDPLEPASPSTARTAVDDSRPTLAAPAPPPPTSRSPATPIADAGTTPAPITARRFTVPTSDTNPGEQFLDGIAKRVSAIGSRLRSASLLREGLRTNAVMAKRDVDAWCKAVAANPNPIPEGQCTRDAGPWLNPRVPWEGGGPSPFDLPDALAKSLGEPTWPKLAPASVAGLDTTWLRELGAYDCWSIAASGPFHDSTLPLYSRPMVRFYVLMRWARVRWIQALETGELETARDEVRHFAQLVASTQTLLGNMFALTLLRNEAVAVAEARARGMTVSWEPYDPEALRNAQRLLVNSPRFLFPGVDEDTAKKALACAPRRCMMTMEALGARRTVDRYSEAAPPGASSEGCDAELVKLTDAARPDTAVDLVEGGGVDEWLNNPLVPKEVSR